MDIGNIMVVVCIWNSGVTIGDNRLRGGEFFRMITDRARELLTSIKEGVQTEMLDTSRAGISPGGSPRRAGMNQTARGGDNNRGGGNYDMLNVQKHPGMQSLT